MKTSARLLPILVFLFFAQASWAETPLDPKSFTAQMQQKLQLYTPLPVIVAGPLLIGVKTGATQTSTTDLTQLHDQCTQAPASCDDRIHDFVQEFARAYQEPAIAHDVAVAAAPPLPEDKDAFMTRAAQELQRRLPAATVAAGDMRLTVTRTGGKPIVLDATSSYHACAALRFACQGEMNEFLDSLALWLAPSPPSSFRASLHVMDSCSTIASVGNSIVCRIRPSPAPLSVFFRRAFANLEVVCFKSTEGGRVLPAVNADRKDLDLDIDAALDLCIRQTQGILPPLSLDPAGGTISAPYAASLALFPELWAPVLAGRRLLVAVPSRDLLLYSFLDGAADTAALGNKAMAAFLGNTGLGISADVYRWTGDSFTLATDRSVMTGPRISTEVLSHSGGRGL